MHDLVPHETGVIWGDLLVGRLTCQLFDALIVHSEWAKKTLKRAWPLINAERIFVIPHPNFIDCYDNDISREEARKRFGLQKGELVFLFLGLIRPYKGVEDLILSFRSIPNTNLRLIIAGKPLTPAFGRKLASSAEGDSRIQFFPGFIPPHEIQRFMNASDVVVFPYRRVFTSGAVLLAMSFGKACIATEVGSIEEVLTTDGGMLCPAHDPVALRAALLNAASFESQLAEMGRRNLERVKQWSWDAMAQRTAELYRSIQNYSS
jgi:glycosyltransferase involved in cell wall biosynthesis